jgi:hypothetical protein
MPNPKGLDKNEWVEIENKSKKKVNLESWSIATGWKKLINHPIREKFEIKPGKSKKLTKKICAFTLVNTKDKIELRSPNGETVQKIKYDHGKDSISEDELYSNVDGKWQWLKTQTNTELSLTNTEITENTLPPSEEENNPIIRDLEIQDSLGKYTTSPDWKKMQKNRLILAYRSHNIILSEKFLDQKSQVLGVGTGFKPVRSDGNFYIFTKPENRKHWALEIWENFLVKINSRMNLILNAI